MKSIVRILVWIGAGLASVAAAESVPPRLPLDVFFGGNSIRQPLISPTGRYLAWLQPTNRRFNLVVLDRQAGKKTRITDMKEENILSFLLGQSGPPHLFSAIQGPRIHGCLWRECRRHQARRPPPN